MNSTLDLNESSLTNEEDEENEDDGIGGGGGDLWPPPPAPTLHRTSDMSQSGMVLSSIQTPLAGNGQLQMTSTASLPVTAAASTSVKGKRQAEGSFAKSKSKAKKFDNQSIETKKGRAAYTKKQLEHELTALSGWTSDSEDNGATGVYEGVENGPSEHSIWTEDGLHRFNL